MICNLFGLKNKRFITFLKKKSNFSFIKLRAGNKYKGPDF